MHVQVSEKYRLIGRSLYRYEARGNAYVHCALIPLGVRGLASAVKWFESGRD